MNSTVVGMPNDDPVEGGDQRDIIAMRGLRLGEWSGTAPWDGDPLSDHFRLDAVLRTGELLSTLNVNGATLSKREGKTFTGCHVIPELLATFRWVWDQSIATFFGPLLESGALDVARFNTALRFWKGPTVRELNIAARFVSPFLQGENDIHALATELAKRLRSGATPVQAALRVAGLVKLDGRNWKAMHALPRDADTGVRLANDHKPQQRTNLALFFYYLAVVHVECPDGFEVALDTAPSKPTGAALVAYIEGVLQTEDPQIFALQEVPRELIASIREMCAKHGYEAHAAPPAREAGVVTITKTPARGRATSSAVLYGDSAHRALATMCALEDGTTVSVLNFHGDEKGLTRQQVRAFNTLHPKGPAIVLGDAQIGKVDGNHAQVTSDIAADIGVPREHLHTTPPLLTRVRSSTPNVFCAQFKFTDA